MNGHDVSILPSSQNAFKPTIVHYQHEDESYENEYSMAADTGIKDLPEEERISILKRCILSLLGYDPKNSIFSKQRHWEAIYRIAVDYGLVIDGDYNYFKNFIDKMNLKYIPAPLTESVIERLNQGVYANHFEEWSETNIDAKQLKEFNDIRACAEAFERIVKANIPQKSAD